MLSCSPPAIRHSCIFTMAPESAWIPYCPWVSTSLWMPPCFSFRDQLAGSVCISRRQAITTLARCCGPCFRLLSYRPSRIVPQPTKWPSLVWARPLTNSVSPRLGSMVWNIAMVNSMCRLGHGLPGCLVKHYSGCFWMRFWDFSQLIE